MTLAALAPRPGERLWDVGAGSGSIAIEWSRSGPGCRAVAFERDETRRVRIAANVSAHGVDVDVRGPAPDGFGDAEPPSAIFIGGGLTHPGVLDGCLAALPSGGRLVANAVTAESEAVMVQQYSQMGERCAATSTTRASRWAPSPAGAPPCRSRSGCWSDRDRLLHRSRSGAADLITVRGQRLLGSCPVCLYAGSIMPDDLLALCPADARIVDTGPLTLDQIIDELAEADAAGKDVARLHSGDPSIYSALTEQCRRLDALGIDYQVVPGVPAFAAAAAALGRELTVPGVAQTVTLSRVATLSTAMPPAEDLRTLSAAGGTLVLHLAAAQIDNIVPELLAGATRLKHPVRWWRSRAGRRRSCCAAPSPTSPRRCTTPGSPAPR